MMSQKLLIVWSNYYPELAQQQLSCCQQLLTHSTHSYDTEYVNAGCYEIPAVIQYFQRHRPYQGYLPLGLLLQGATDHYDFIWQHIKECFIQFALDGIMIGNGIITAPNMPLLTARVNQGTRIQEAVQALSYLLTLEEKIKPVSKSRIDND